ncbi:hypothetical protein BH09PSE2_BH09PSE2_02850 [soil metagenome]
MLAPLLALLLAPAAAQTNTARGATPEVAAEPPARLVNGRLITDPAWRVKPTRADVLAVFPPKAARAGIGGVGAIACTVDEDGSPLDCKASAEEPAASGFAEAALALVPTMRFKTGTVNGRVVGDGRIAIPIRFDPPDLGERAFGPDTVMGAGSWLGAPDAAQVQAAYPAAALKAKRSGLGVIRCTVRGGQLGDCRAIGEDVDRFSRAALKLTSLFLMDDTFIGGGSTNGAIMDIPVAFGGDRAAAPSLVGAPQWIRKPAADLVAAAFPPQAVDAGVTRIDVTPICRVVAGGGLGACALLSESPAGFGGAEAAARLANVYQTGAWSREGRPTAGLRLQLPIVLEHAAALPPPPRSTPPARPRGPRPAR